MPAPAFCRPPRSAARGFALAAILAASAAPPAQAQLGTGWIATNYNKSIHLDDESGLQTFSWSPYRSVCSPICADYGYQSATQTETFRIFDSRSNRSEIRLQNNYSGGMWQFEGYVTFDDPLHDESLFQIFGNTGDAATFLMMRGYRDNGGTIRVMGGSNTIATGVYGQEVRINVIHEYNVSAKFYVNGNFIYEKPHNDPGVTNYWKYGVYGTTSGNVPAVVEWRAVRTFRDGLPPGAFLGAGAYEAEDGVLSGAVVASSQPGYTGTGYVDYINPSGDYIDWSVNVERAGLYDLNFRYALQSGDRPLEIQVNGNVVKADLSFPATGAWSTWAYAKLPLQPLGAGANSIRASAVGTSGANLDHLRVSALEAEAAFLAGAVVANNREGFTGPGFADYVNASGDYVEWTFNLADGGNFDVNFRYALESGERPLEIRLNGQVVDAAMNFPVTGAWTSWAYATLPTQALQAGTNTIRATAIGSSGPNVDNLLLSLPSANVGMPGDYNNDGMVDAADYIVWRRDNGTPDGYETWRTNFGNTAASGVAADDLLSPRQVPEPSSLMLCVALVAMAAGIARRPA